MTVCFSYKNSPSGVVKFYDVTLLYLSYRKKGLKNYTQVPNDVIDRKQISLLENTDYELVWVVRCEIDAEYALPYRDAVLQWIKEK